MVYAILLYLQQPFGNCQEDLVLPDFFYEVLVEGEDDLGAVVIYGDAGVSGVVEKLQDGADDVAGCGVADDAADDAVIFIFGIGAFGEADLPAHDLLCGRQRINIFQLDQVAASLGFDRFDKKRNRQSIEIDEYRFVFPDILQNFTVAADYDRAGCSVGFQYLGHVVMLRVVLPLRERPRQPQLRQPLQQPLQRQRPPQRQRVLQPQPRRASLR